MDALFEFATLLVEHPMLSALIEVGTLILLIWLWRDMLRSREEYQRKVSEHERECAERWGYVKAKLDEIDRRGCS